MYARVDVSAFLAFDIDFRGGRRSWHFAFLDRDVQIVLDVDHFLHGPRGCPVGTERCAKHFRILTLNAFPSIYSHLSSQVYVQLVVLGVKGIFIINVIFDKLFAMFYLDVCLFLECLLSALSEFRIVLTEATITN